MITKQDIIDQALALGFADIGFTTAEPFESQRERLSERQAEYAWTKRNGFDLELGTDPRNTMADAKAIIVVIIDYYRETFPATMEAHFGRCYLDDDRQTKDRGTLRIKAFRKFLSDNGIDSKPGATVPNRLAAARAGLGSFGKNCLFFANQGALGGSWTSPVPLVINVEFAPDSPSIDFGCPDWCKSTCVVACPTGALQGSGKIDPRKCISYLSYHGETIPPMELREPMGSWVYGCDHCQNVCPRNIPWQGKPRPANEKVAAMTEDFALRKLLHMDEEYFNARIFPHMFYMPSSHLWHWKMNVARAIGNGGDASYVPDLVRAFRENSDERVCSMIAWALGRLGGTQAKAALEEFFPGSAGMVREEIQHAVAKFSPATVN